MNQVHSLTQHKLGKLKKLGEKLDQHLQQHLLLKERLEANRQAWHAVVKEYEALERELKDVS